MAQNVNDSQAAGEMSFWGHLQALRSVLLRIAVVVVALAFRLCAPFCCAY